MLQPMSYDVAFHGGLDMVLPLLCYDYSVGLVRQDLPSLDVSYLPVFISISCLIRLERTCFSPQPDASDTYAVFQTSD